ncbi:MAG: hypothetical protein ACHQK9_19675 [Reyranellales bacterium]
MRLLVAALMFVLCGHSGALLAADELAKSAPMANGQTINYILTTASGEPPRYAVILMPGGPGILNPRLEGTKLVMSGGGNFLIRSRALFATGPFVAASTDATTTVDRMMAVINDIERRYGKIEIYLVGTSRSTESTMGLAKPLDGRVAGFVHSSSMSAISSFDPRGLKSRHLIVLHAMDACRATRPSAGVASHRSYGTDLITMEGGKSTGDDCEAYAYHGYNGIEKETVDKIKAWIVAGK